MGTDRNCKDNELFDNAVLAALLKAATSSESDHGGLSVPSGSRLFTLENPFGSVSSAAPLNLRNDVSKDDFSDDEKKRIKMVKLDSEILDTCSEKSLLAREFPCCTSFIQTGSSFGEAY